MKWLAAEPGATLREASNSRIGRIPCVVRRTWNTSTGIATTMEEARAVAVASPCTERTSSELRAAAVKPHVRQTKDCAGSSLPHRVHFPARQRRKLRNGRSAKGNIGKAARHMSSSQESSQTCQRVLQNKWTHNTIDPIAATQQILGIAASPVCWRDILRSVQISETPAAKIAMGGIRNMTPTGPGNQSGRTTTSHRGQPRSPSRYVHSPRTYVT